MRDTTKVKEKNNVWKTMFSNAVVDQPFSVISVINTKIVETFRYDHTLKLIYVVNMLLLDGIFEFSQIFCLGWNGALRPQFVQIRRGVPGRLALYRSFLGPFWLLSLLWL